MVPGVPPFCSQILHGWGCPLLPALWIPENMSCKIILVGEAFGEEEDRLGVPFAGTSGQELFKMLGEAWGHSPEEHLRICSLMGEQSKFRWTQERQGWLAECGLGMDNVFLLRPPGNKLDSMCVPKKELPQDYQWPSLARSLYLRPEFLPHPLALLDRLRDLRPNLVVALGNTPSWALLRATNITQIRGAVAECPAIPGLKVLPTFHPAAVLRQWQWRPIVVADLMKAKREGEFPELRRPKREVLWSPTLEEVRAFRDQILANPPPELGADIETANRMIKMISFAPSPASAICIPFQDPEHRQWHYWPTAEAEAEVWGIVKEVLESPIPKVGQNFLYDIQYLIQAGIFPRNCRDDTMLKHHSEFPEMQKSLGFLGSVYTDEASWKLMRRRRPDTEKRDD